MAFETLRSIAILFSTTYPSSVEFSVHSQGLSRTLFSGCETLHTFVIWKMHNNYKSNSMENKLDKLKSQKTILILYTILIVIGLIIAVAVYINTEEIFFALLANGIGGLPAAFKLFISYERDKSDAERAADSLGDRLDTGGAIIGFIFKLLLFVCVAAVASPIMLVVNIAKIISVNNEIFQLEVKEQSEDDRTIDVSSVVEDPHSELEIGQHVIVKKNGLEFEISDIMKGTDGQTSYYSGTLNNFFSRDEIEDADTYKRMLASQADKDDISQIPAPKYKVGQTVRIKANDEKFAINDVMNSSHSGFVYLSKSLNRYFFEDEIEEYED